MIILGISEAYRLFAVATLVHRMKPLLMQTKKLVQIWCKERNVDSENRGFMRVSEVCISLNILVKRPLSGISQEGHVAGKWRSVWL